MSKGAIIIVIIIIIAVAVFAGTLLRDRLSVSKNESDAAQFNPALQRTISPHEFPVATTEPKIEAQSIIEKTFDDIEYNPFE